MVNRLGSYAVGMSGEDAGLIRVDQRDPRLGFVGDVRSIDPTMVVRLLREELIPIIATVGVDDDGQAYNVNADTVAGAIAVALDAEKLVYLTDVAGVYGDWPDESSLISRIDVDGLEQLIAGGKASDGMIPKLESCVAGVAQRRAARAHPRRPPAARAAARILHPGGRRNDGRTHERVHGTPDARRRERDADLRSAPRRVRPRRRNEALGQRGQGVPRLPHRSRGDVARARASRGRRPRSPIRRTRCCTSRTSITTTCSRGWRRG